MTKSNIALIGMSGAGKTTIGRLLAAELNKNFCDTDELFVSRYGNISEFFALEGEAKFRVLEKELSLEAVGGKDTVISLGGGAVLIAELMERVRRNCTVVLLACSAEVLARRITFDTDRPLMKEKDDVATVYAARRSLYFSNADLIFDTSEQTPETSAKLLKKLLLSD